MKKARCRKWLAVVLSLALALSMLPGAAFAEEVEPPAEETLSCQLTEGCTLEQGHEGMCHGRSGRSDAGRAGARGGK